MFVQLMHCANMEYTVNMDYSSESVTHVDV